MPELQHRSGRSDGERLAACVQNVDTARARLRAARRPGVQSSTWHPLRADLLIALERYAAAISGAGAPVPRRLRTEIDLYRRLRNIS